jgi:hypothetical protein
MRKATISMLLLMCSVVAFGQSEPQWRVVKHGFLTNQTVGIQTTTLFTPTKTDLYRMSIYISASGADTNWQMALDWTDLAGIVQRYVSSPSGGTQPIWKFPVRSAGGNSSQLFCRR